MGESPTLIKQRMKTLTRTLLASITASFYLLGCNQADIEEPIKEYQPTQISEDITDLFEARGNENADTVWVFEQGGPKGQLFLGTLYKLPNYDNYLHVYAHQVLTYNSDLYDRTLTEERAGLEVDVQSEILHKVIQYFKDQGKTVIAIGHSYGAFVMAHYLAKEGSELADKFVLMAGRLDIEQIVYEGLLAGQFYIYPDYQTPALHPTFEATKEARTELYIAGVTFKPRYTQELSNVDLSKVIYVFANDDDLVGRLTTLEKDFLNSKNVQLVEIESGGHEAMFSPPYNQIIYELMIK
jgi:hypothetical protein